MSLTREEFFKAWLSAGESQELHVTETAWKRYCQTQQPGYRTTSEENDPSEEALRSSFQPFLTDESVASSIAESKFFTIQCNKLPWRATGIHLQPGQQVSIFATGRVWRSRLLDLYLPPQFGLSYRIGLNGTAFNATRDTATFDGAEEGGELYVANQFPGQFDKNGRIIGSLGVYDNVDGKFEVLVVAWKSGTEVEKTLMQYHQNTTSDELSQRLIRMESERPTEENSTNLPDNEWYYFWFIGNSTIYSRFSQPGNESDCIRCKPDRNVGILQKDLSPTLPFKSNTTVHWAWKIDSLPSRVREDTTFSHDYLSIAFEFENGRDITYTWSWELPVDYGYWCPLPTWEEREYHVVIRSGTKGLGEWIEEKRDLYEDYKHYIGEMDLPERIVRVWLIAGNWFQRHDGDMTVREVVVDGDGGQEIHVL